MYSVLINPTAGRGHASQAGVAIEQALTARGIAFETLTTSYPGHAETLAREAVARGAKTIVVVGGDGTLFEAARGMNGSEAALAIIPAGTGNDFIKSLDLPRKPLEALEHALTHPPRQVDAGWINGTLFGNECGAGFDVSVLEYARRIRCLGQGLAPYLVGVICAVVKYKPITLSFFLEDSRQFERQVTVFAVANGRMIGGGIPIAPLADVQDGLFDIVILNAMPRRKMIPLLPGLLAGKILSFPGVETFRCQRIAIKGHDLHINIDGEIKRMNEAVFEIKPNALWVHA